MSKEAQLSLAKAAKRFTSREVPRFYFLTLWNYPQGRGKVHDLTDLGRLGRGAW